MCSTAPIPMSSEPAEREEDRHLARAHADQLLFENSTRTRRPRSRSPGKRLGAMSSTWLTGSRRIRKGETLIRHRDDAERHTRRAGRPPPRIGRGAAIVGKGRLRRHQRRRRQPRAPDPGPARRADDPPAQGAARRATVAICGDILHSRVARSNIALLNAMGARVRVVAPRTLLPAQVERLGVEVFHDMTAGLKDVDIVMMLRLQMERMHGSSFLRPASISTSSASITTS